MTIGRFTLIRTVFKIRFGYERSVCGCRFLDLGPWLIEWASKECWCTVCKENFCVCDDED